MAGVVAGGAVRGEPGAPRQEIAALEPAERAETTDDERSVIVDAGAELRGGCEAVRAERFGNDGDRSPR